MSFLRDSGAAVNNFSYITSFDEVKIMLIIIHNNFGGEEPMMSRILACERSKHASP